MAMKSTLTPTKMHILLLVAFISYTSLAPCVKKQIKYEAGSANMNLYDSHIQCMRGKVENDLDNSSKIHEDHKNVQKKDEYPTA